MILDGFAVCEKSIAEKNGGKYALVRDVKGRDFLYIERGDVKSFCDCTKKEGGFLCPFTYKNAVALSNIFPYLRSIPFGLKGPSFGFGDRLGLATPGHIRALAGREVFPVFAQQSIREMQRTKRTPEDVVKSAILGVFEEGFTKGFGSDADHLRSLEDLNYVIPYRYSMFTCDPSNYVNNKAATMDDRELKTAFSLLGEHMSILKHYAGRAFRVKGYTFEFSELDIMRAAVKYFDAIKFAATMFERIRASVDYEFDFEISVDETDTPTTFKEHIFIVNELRRLGVKFTAIAPRFIGDFYKGVDYAGDLKEFENSIRIHKMIIDEFGPYKISVHSGSDKLSIYPILGEHFGNLLHIKTAGTSYLEALRVIAREEPSLFVEIYNFSLKRFDEDKKSYHIDVKRDNLPEIEGVCEGLERLLENYEVRQMLHVTYGSVLTSRLGEELITVIRRNYREKYNNALERHFKRHLSELFGGE